MTPHGETMVCGTVNQKLSEVEFLFDTFHTHTISRKGSESMEYGARDVYLTRSLMFTNLKRSELIYLITQVHLRLWACIIRVRPCCPFKLRMVRGRSSAKTAISTDAM